MASTEDATRSKDINGPEERTAELFDPHSPQFRVDPYAFYRRLREVDPVHWADGSWYLTRYADTVEVLKDPRFGLEIRSTLPTQQPREPGPYQPLSRLFDNWMLLRDPPDHTRLRGLVSKAFTPRVVERLHPFVEGIANELIDRVQYAVVMDLIADFALPLPVIAIAELLGAPPEDRDLFKMWSVPIARALDPNLTPAIAEEATRATLESEEYYRKMVAERRKNPKDDLTSDLIAAEEQGDKLSEDELLATCSLVLGAGHETTTNLIGNGTLALLRHPEQLEKLRNNPGLIQPAVEELLRYDSPVQMVHRLALEDVQIGDQVIRRGESVNILLGAANRDPERFPDPDQLDLTRENNHHLSFSHGIHFCVGAALARAEGQIAIQTLLRRMPNLELQSETLEWMENIRLRGLKSLPVLSL